MFRYRQGGTPRGTRFTTLVLAASAVITSLGCMDDGAQIIGQPGDGSPTGSDGAKPSDDSGGSQQAISNDDPAAPGGTSEGGPTNLGNPGGQVSGVDTPGGIGQGPGGGDCWQLPVVDHARLLPASGRAADLVGGKIVGSLNSATNGFVDLGVIEAAPAEGEPVDLPLANATAYRFVKYYSPGGSYGAVAEVELFAGDQKLSGASFGTAGSRDEAGTTFDYALDGDPSTFFEGPLPNDNYVGLDLGDGHEAAAPAFTPAPGSVAAGSSVTLAAAAGASIAYTTDGSDPAVNGVPYTGAIVLPAGSTLVRAVATTSCALPSPVAQGVFTTPGGTSQGPGAGPKTVQSSLHIGNSLTDTINDHLQTVAASAGISLDYNRYTIPGAGTWLYDQNPTGGFGVANVQEALRTQPFDHVSMQPYPNLPCQAVPSADGDDSDSGYLAEAWADAQTQNPLVQFWVYQQWPTPADFITCMSGGGWTRGDWDPPAPQTWEDSVANELSYQELVRSTIAAQFPDAPAPYIVPGGLALVTLKHAMEDGQVPGMTDFFGTIFQAAGEDIHLTAPGAYYITLVFYGCMFQQSPEGLVNDSAGTLSDQQATIFQQLAWQTLQGYPLSGITR
jgi:chitobiase/beta-hexosaminidase-like protein